uniref:Uncharacterized protein n=1 Tax=Steinernema glaseri TaxID=37863 RepID=A0A1I8A1G5_9BILA
MGVQKKKKLKKKWERQGRRCASKISIIQQDPVPWITALPRRIQYSVYTQCAMIDRWVCESVQEGLRSDGAGRKVDMSVLEPTKLWIFRRFLEARLASWGSTHSRFKNRMFF